MNKNVPKNGQNIAISFKFHETVKLIVPNDLDIWTDWCHLGLQFVVYKSAEQEWSFNMK